MPRFLVDEDLPRSLTRALRTGGFDAQDVRDVGRALVTADLGFANILTVPLSSHHGILVVRLPNVTPVGTLNAVVLSAVRALAAEELRSCLVIVEPSRIRLRRPR